ncbi:MAG TPA: ABC transporter permease [Gemmatimonadaceae bacterium]|nr:ABC transporter permease [Gemmatimonadaceae bacterium]
MNDGQQRGPALPNGIRRVFRLATRRAPVEADIDDEIAFHVEMHAAELTARHGLAPAAARDEALRRFGDIYHWRTSMSAIDREHAVRRRRVEWVDDLRQDLRYGVRSALRTPLFSLLAIVTIAFGIGANAAVFGVVKSVLLDALPYSDADRLVRVYGRLIDGSMERAPLTVGTIVDLRARQRSFTQIAAFEGRARDAIFEGDGGPRVLKAGYAEPALFPTLGTRVALGRVLRDDDAVGDTAYSVVLTHELWQKLFASDVGAVGQQIRVNGIPRTVVGVLPRGFVGPVSDVELYMPLDLRGLLRDPVRARRQHSYGIVARMKPGVDAAVAQREVVTFGADLAREYPVYNGRSTMRVIPVREDMVGDTRTPLLVLMASAGLVLVIACANLAGALLARAISRRREFAVRVAIGAGQGRLVRQLLTESMVLAIAGGAAGVLLALGGLAVLRRLALRALPAYADLSLDLGALLVTAVLALATGLVFGIAPALSVSRASVEGGTLRDESRGSSESRRSRQLRGVLVAGQIALCVSLLAGAGLLARSLWAMTTAPLGLTPGGVLTVAVELPSGSYKGAQARRRFIEQYEGRLRALPGVASVATAGALPTRVSDRNEFSPANVPAATDNRPIALYSTVSDDYFRTLGIPLLDGRAFGPEDPAETLQGTPAVIITQSMARRWWPNGDAIGSGIRLDPEPGSPPMTIVGVVGDVRHDPARAEPEPELYMSIRQAPWNGPVFLVRTRGDPLALLPAARRELAAIDRAVPVRDAGTLESIVTDRLAARRLPVMLMTAFGALALLLASVGVYAMFASMAAAREREFGVRIALGASRRAIANLVLVQGGVWMLVGLVAGAGGIVVVARAVRGLLYGVQPFDPATLVAVVLTLVACGTLALLGPVRRATRVDPISVLR